MAYGVSFINVEGGFERNRTMRELLEEYVLHSNGVLESLFMGLYWYFTCAELLLVSYLALSLTIRCLRIAREK